MDLNCDLGEGEPARIRRALFRSVTSANIACGGHAGTADSIVACVRDAALARVNIGAHPGPWNREDFGRAPIRIDPPALELLLLHQVGAVAAAARAARVPLHHVKLHGGLYHAVESDLKLARAYVRCIARWWPQARLYGQLGGSVEHASRSLGFRFWAEGFLDRAYATPRSLVPRAAPGALLTARADWLERIHAIHQHRTFATACGEAFDCSPVRTWCVHSDTPGAAALARLAAGTLRPRRSRR